MKRWTHRDANGVAHINGGHCEAAAYHGAMQKLAAYEDTGMSPERLQWISMEDESPPSMELVLVLYGNGHITTSFMGSSGDWHFIQTPNANITHWMPLLIPPGMPSC